MADTENKKIARRRMLGEALFLFVFAWIAAIVAFILRPTPIMAPNGYGLLYVLGSTFLSGLEFFVFGYILSRFFKQFKTGCALVIILFFAYLIWAGRRP